MKEIYKTKQPLEKERLTKELEDLKREGQQLNKSVAELELELGRLVGQVGNLVEEGVQVHSDEEYNKVCEEWGEPRTHDVPYWDILEKRLDAVDMKRGSKVAGHRGYFLKGVGVRLTQAITQYGMDFLEKEGYTLHQTPVIIKSNLMKACCQLSSIKEDVFQIQDEDSMLIATSEQSLASMYSS